MNPTNLMAVLVGYEEADNPMNFGAIMVYVVRRQDIRDEFKVQMSLRKIHGKRFKITWWRPACWPETF